MDEFKFEKKMEDMVGDKLKERIKQGWEFKTPQLTPIPYIGKIDQTIVHLYHELVALCPVTGITDLYTIKIEYTPDKIIPELKTLKLYFLSFRNLPISHEHLHAKIFKEFKEQVQPKLLNIHLDVAIRGGIKTDITYKENGN